MHEDGKGRKVVGSCTKAPPFFAGTVIGSAAKKRTWIRQKAEKSPEQYFPFTQQRGRQQEPQFGDEDILKPCHVLPSQRMSLLLCRDSARPPFPFK